jgi:plasmid stabilization system protein ParE
MATPFQLTPRALNDLSDIWEYVAEDNVSAANRVESAIFSACNSLARHPLIGSKRTEITPLPVRFWAVTIFQLHHCLPPRQKAATGCRGAAWKKKYQGSA